MVSKKTSKKVKEMSKITTIKLLGETKLRLEKLRENKGESYDDILRKILYVLNLAREDPEKARRTLQRISQIRKQNFQEGKEIEKNLKKEKKEQVTKIDITPAQSGYHQQDPDFHR